MKSTKKHGKLETATFAAGCFWEPQLVFDNTPGVIETQVGFTGGNAKNPSYLLVCTGLTGHREVVQVKFDPKMIPYEKLLEIFWEVHDPTQANGQGVNAGSQYRAAVFYHGGEQKKLAEKTKAELEKKGMKIATQILPAGEFYLAEEYHQKYLQKRGLKTC
ncbi:MAG: peptide-methionine (S)-S-oxide reductase MsrA [Candidatus Norongarragalinales archaeon]